MSTTLWGSDKQGIGIMIVEEFIGFGGDEFIRAACPYQEFPSYVYARWRDSTRQPREEIPFCYCSVKLQGDTVHLFAYPDTLMRDFFLEDLQFPMKLQGLGFVVILDLSFLPHFEKSSLSTKIRDPIKSALVWTIAHNLPFIVVAKAQDASPIYSTEELRSIFELSADVPIYRCSADFDGKLVRQVLRNLLKQFEAP